VVEHIVAETQAVDLNPSPAKRKFEEVEHDLIVTKVKTERSMSTGCDLYETTSTSISNVKIEVDEETSKAASILEGVSTDPRNVLELLAKTANPRWHHFHLPCRCTLLRTAYR